MPVEQRQAVTPELVEKMREAVLRLGNKQAAADELGIPRSTVVGHTRDILGSPKGGGLNPHHQPSQTPGERDVEGTLRMVPIADIVVPEGRRPVKNVEALADSIRQSGLLNPVTLSEDHRLIAGRNRLAACHSLGMLDIPAMVFPITGLAAEMAEIDENLIRNELAPEERRTQLLRRKEIYESIHPVQKPVHLAGVAGPGRGNIKTDDTVSPVSFAADTAAKTGLSERTIQREIRIARDITEPVKDIIRNTPVADDKTALLNIARQPPEKQEEAAKEAIRKKAAPRPKATGRRKRSQGEIHPNFARAATAVDTATSEITGDPPVSVTPTFDRAAYDTPLVRQLAGKKAASKMLERDLKLFDGTKELRKALAATAEALVGRTSAAWLSPLQQAIFDLVNVLPPSAWQTCSKCKGDSPTCTKCKGAGYQIPNL